MQSKQRSITKILKLFMFIIYLFSPLKIEITYLVEFESHLTNNNNKKKSYFFKQNCLNLNIDGFQVQYLVAKPFDWITAGHLRGIDATKF